MAPNNSNNIIIVGGGLAGCEAAWQAASSGVPVTLHEMRPVRPTAVHQTDRLAELVCSNSLRGDTVVVSIPGQSGLARFVKLPPVEEKKIQDIVRFEAKQQIPFNLEEVVWDYQKIGSGQVTDGFAMETEIGLFAIKRDMVSRALQHFKDVGVDVHVIGERDQARRKDARGVTAWTSPWPSPWAAPHRSPCSWRRSWCCSAWSSGTP